jgi:putative ABC transport system substrate-binding protein
VSKVWVTDLKIAAGQPVVPVVSIAPIDRFRHQLVFVATVLCVGVPTVSAQQAHLHRIGVIHEGGPYNQTVDGLKDGLKSLGLEQGRDFVLHVRDVKGDLKAVAEAASALEAERVDIIFSVATSVTVEVKRATKVIPIVFYAGADPVAHRLIEKFARPGGRLTGIFGRTTDLTAKRLELLKQLVPRMRRVVIFYDPSNAIAVESLRVARDAARRLGLELIERPVESIQDFQAGLRALKATEADAVFYAADAMITSQEPLLLKTAIAKKLPAISTVQQNVRYGALAGYGVSYSTIGRNSAKYIKRVLDGESPGALPVEQIDTYYFIVNLKTAAALGLKIPASVLARADEVIQ